MLRILAAFLLVVKLASGSESEPFRSKHCPEDDSKIHPCSCGQYTSFPLPSLFCNSTDLTVWRLERVLEEVPSDSFNHLQILNANLGKIPRNFDGTKDFLAIMLGNSNVKEIDHFAFEGSFETLENLVIRENPELVAFPFNALNNYEKLVSVYMHDNGIKEFKDFPTMTNLNTLMLTRNVISSLEPLPFNPQLRYVSFAWNQIRDVPLESFLQLPIIAEVDLSGNKLENLKKNTLIFESKDMVSIVLRDCELENIEVGAISGINPHTIIDLTNNNLRTLPEEVFNPLIQKMWKNMGLIKLHGNPLQCSCEGLQWLGQDEEYLIHFPGAICDDGTKLGEFLKNNCSHQKTEL